MSQGSRSAAPPVLSPLALLTSVAVLSVTLCPPSVRAALHPATPGWNLFSLPVIPADNRITTLLPTYGTELDTLARYDPTYNHPFTGHFQHYVGKDPKFDDFTTLDYGRGYQLYCTNPSGCSVTLKGRLPTKPLATSLSTGWHLLPAITLDGPQPLSWLLPDVPYDQVYGYNATTQQLERATDVKPYAAYYVNVAASTFSPPLPRDVTTRFVYDGDGGRVKQITASGTTIYLGDVFEQDPTGKTTTYLFAGSLRIAAKDSTGAIRFYHGDHLGSSNVVTDGSGAVVELAEHTPYGSLSRREGPANVAHQFTGQRQDDRTGLILFPARPYDPALGRFLQPDTLIPDPSVPQFLNRYSYVRNNPLNATDPTGQCELICWIFIAIFVAAVAVGSEAHARQQEREFFREAQTPPAALPALDRGPVPSFRPTGPLATLGTGNLRLHAVGPPLDVPELHEVALNVLNTGLLFYGVAGLTRAAIGSAFRLSVRQALTRQAVREVADTSLTDSLFKLIPKDMPAMNGLLLPAPESVVRFATNPFKTGLKALGQWGGRWATTVEQAEEFGGFQMGSFRVLVGPQARKAINRLALRTNSIFRGFVLYGRTIGIPHGTKARYGFVQSIGKLLGGAKEFFFQ